MSHRGSRDHWDPPATILVVADVSSHGVASAMTASILKALVPRHLGGPSVPSRGVGVA